MDTNKDRDKTLQEDAPVQQTMEDNNSVTKREELLHGTNIDKVAYRYAGFWMRFWAFLLDLIIIGSLNRIIVYPVLRALDMSLNDSSMFAPVSIITAIIFYGYFVLMTKYFGQTLGKMVFGLKVISLKQEKLNWSTIMFREWIGRFISGTIFILYVVVAFLPKKQAVHDLFADTTVIHEK
jgi:uncharacterized RDD family membrane protein YckC